MRGLAATTAVDRRAEVIPPRRATRLRTCVVLLCLLAFASNGADRAFGQNTTQGPTPLPPSSTLATAQASPTPDPERLKLEKDKLRLETEKLSIENENNKHDFSPRRLLGNILYGNLAFLLGFLLALGGLIKYFWELRTTRRKRDEERFENVVKSLGSQYEQERISAAVLLPTFLEPEYSRFHVQVFNLAAGHLRMGSAGGAPASVSKIEIPGTVRSLTVSLADDALPVSSPPALAPGADASTTLPHPLTQPLATVLCRSYWLIREAGTISSEAARRRQLNAFGVHMEGVELSGVDLRHALLKQATLRGATLENAFLAWASLEGADLSETNLKGIELVSTTLVDANFMRADLTTANLNQANLDGANFYEAQLTEVEMARASARGTRFDKADLSGARLSGVEFGLSESNGRRANPEDALTLTNATFRNVSGLTEEQVALCMNKGAIFLKEDEPEAAAVSSP